MVLCLRCQRNIAQFECEICNGVYCPDCDKFIHSNKPKINHKRNEIKNYEQNENPRTIEKISINPNLNYSNKITNLNNLDNFEQSQSPVQNKTENYLLNSNSNTNINKNNYSLYQENIENNNKSIKIPNEIEQENKYKLL